MILISHRGNINGPNPEKENTKEYIQSALDMGYHVEIDVFSKNGQLFLGHDAPEHEVELEWLLERREKLWVHAKNSAALFELTFDHLNPRRQLTVFFHEQERYALIYNARNAYGVVVHGVIWSRDITDINSKCVIPLLSKKMTGLMPKKKIWGVCSDYVELLKDEQ